MNKTYFFFCRLFYGKKLLDGVTSEDRSPIVVSVHKFSATLGQMIHPGNSCTDFNPLVVQLEKMNGFFRFVET